MSSGAPLGAVITAGADEGSEKIEGILYSIREWKNESIAKYRMILDEEDAVADAPSIAHEYRPRERTGILDCQ